MILNIIRYVSYIHSKTLNLTFHKLLIRYKNVYDTKQNLNVFTATTKASEIFNRWKLNHWFVKSNNCSRNSLTNIAHRNMTRPKVLVAHCGIPEVALKLLKEE
jgi:hypothetical protein